MHSRRILIFALIAMSIVLVAAGSLVFFGSFKPTDATVQRHVVTVNLTEIAAGSFRLIETTGGPIYVIHRTKDDLSNLDRLSKLVRDPNSTISQQPAYAQNPYRSIDPEWYIGFGFSARRGLPVHYSEQLPPYYDRSVTWFGGFFDQYDGALFDKAGRVFFRGHPNETNLPIPEHKYVDKNTVAIYPFGL